MKRYFTPLDFVIVVVGVFVALLYPLTGYTQVWPLQQLNDDTLTNTLGYNYMVQLFNNDYPPVENLYNEVGGLTDVTIVYTEIKIEVLQVDAVNPFLTIEYQHMPSCSTIITTNIATIDLRNYSQNEKITLSIPHPTIPVRTIFNCNYFDSWLKITALGNDTQFQVYGSSDSESYHWGKAAAGDTFRGNVKDIYFIALASVPSTINITSVILSDTLQIQTSGNLYAGQDVRLRILYFPVSRPTDQFVSDLGVYPSGTSTTWVDIANLWPDEWDIVAMLVNPITGEALAPPTFASRTIWITREGLLIQTATTTIITIPEIKCEGGGWVADSFCKVLATLFSPSPSVWDRFKQLKEDLAEKPPFGYFNEVKNILTGISTTTPAFALVETGVFDDIIFTPLKIALGFIFLLLAVLYIFKRLTDIAL